MSQNFFRIAAQMPFARQLYLLAIASSSRSHFLDEVGAHPAKPHVALYDLPRPSTEKPSMNSSSSLAAIFLSTILITPDIAAAAGGGVNPSMPAETTQPAPAKDKTHSKKSKTTTQKSGSAEDFLHGYRAAYALIYDKGDYVAAIATLQALGHDENADVANLIGYASRKLGRYDDAKIWYERSLAADPNHAVTWSYYGMWHAEQGNILKAKDDLEKVRLICGNIECQPYQMLKEVIDGTATY
jgi:tetratricopeptide (TPR) repeat protein